MLPRSRCDTASVLSPTQLNSCFIPFQSPVPCLTLNIYLLYLLKLSPKHNVISESRVCLYPCQLGNIKTSGQGKYTINICWNK